MAETRPVDQILRLLAARHSKDIFVPQCKDGPTWGSRDGHARIDAWAMARSWKNPLICGYEIKQCRHDFLADEKWVNYLPMCHKLYFVSPYRLIEPNELPNDVGLLWIAKTGSRLWEKKKAPRRNIEMPVNVLMYLLICRTYVCEGSGVYYVQDREYWQRWLAREEADRELGRCVSQQLADYVRGIEQRARVLERKMDTYEAHRDVLRQLGHDPDQPPSEWAFRDKLEDLKRLIPHDLQRAVLDAHSSLGLLVGKLKEMNAETDAALSREIEKRVGDGQDQD